MKDIVKLGTLGDIFIGLTYRPEDAANEGTIVLRSSNIQNGKLDFTDIVRVKCKVRENLIVKPNDILMCSRNGSAKLVGKCTLLPKMDEEMSFGAFMTIIRTRHNPYLLHFFNSNAFRCQLGSAATTTINQITRRMLDDISVPLYPKEQEDYIVSLFNQIDELIWTETQKLELFDELVKSRFIELFGDPVSNPMGWKTELLKNATSKIGSGATPKGGKESYQTEGVTLIRSMNVHDGRFEYKDLAHITDEQAKQLDNVTIEENDVFINITGASVARSCIVPKQILPARVNQHVAIIRCITSKLIPVFANNMFLNNSFKGQLLDIGEAGGATRQAITKQQLETLEVILPPMELQEQFAAFVEQTDKSKMVVQRSIAELEEVKKSLMQKYFG